MGTRFYVRIPGRHGSFRNLPAGDRHYNYPLEDVVLIWNSLEDKPASLILDIAGIWSSERVRQENQTSPEENLISSIARKTMLIRGTITKTKIAKRSAVFKNGNTFKPSAPRIIIPITPRMRETMIPPM